MEMMRTFVAIEPDAPMRAWLEEWLAALRGRFPGIRWVQPSNLHLTLRFLGDIPSDRVGTVSSILPARARGAAPGRLEFGEPGAFGSRGRPRTFWLGFLPGPALEAIRAYQAAVEADLVAAGFAAEDRPFSPHLTVGRNPGGSRTDGWEATLPSPPGPGRPGFEVRSAILFKSDLRPGGPIHTVLSEAPFPCSKETP